MPLKKVKGECIQETGQSYQGLSQLTTATLPFQPFVNRKAQALNVRGNQSIFFTPGPSMFLRDFLLQTQFTAAVPCHRPYSIGAISCIGNAMSAGHIPTKVGFLLCQGKSVFVNIIFILSII